MNIFKFWKEIPLPPPFVCLLVSPKIKIKCSNKLPNWWPRSFFCQNLKKLSQRFESLRKISRRDSNLFANCWRLRQCALEIGEGGIQHWTVSMRRGGDLSETYFWIRRLFFSLRATNRLTPTWSADFENPTSAPLITPVVTITPVPLLYHFRTFYIVRYNYLTTYLSQPTYTINEPTKRKRKRNTCRP